MTLLIDNDIVHKLAQLDLLNEATPLLLEKYGELQILNTMRYKFCPSAQGKRNRLANRYTADVLDRIEFFIENHATEIDCEITDDALIEAMSVSEDGLDIGEMQLLQALLDGGEAFMFTGDKRFLNALALDEHLEVHRSNLEESFVCFEQIIIFLINKIGFEEVKRKYLASLDLGLTVDGTLRLCFSGGTNTDMERTVENLEVNVLQLKQTTIHLLSNSNEWTYNPTNFGDPSVPVSGF